MEFSRSFHSYSLNNLLLLLAQNPEATMVAGFRQWQSKGRQVRKGEKSIRIFGYRQKKVQTGVDEPEDDQRMIRYFPTLSVFELNHVDDIEEYRQHRGRMEVEAESVTFVVVGLHEFDTRAYSIGYIAGWSDEDVRVIQDTAARVLKAAHTIAEILEPHQ